MKLTISAKKMAVSSQFNEYAQTRLDRKLQKFFGDDAIAKITLSPHTSTIVVELTVTYNGMIYRAQQTAVEKEDALDAAIDKIIRQIRKNKTRVEKKLKESAFTDLPQEEEESSHEVVRHKEFVVRPMTLEEAILQMELLGHNFFLFTNAQSGQVNVVYKRADEKYAVLEPIYE